MIEQYKFEFGKIYKRLMELEIIAKDKAKRAIIEVYKDNSYNAFAKFFNDRHIYKNYQSSKGNRLLDIVKNDNLKSEDKIIKLLDILYLSDLLRLILTFEQFFIDEIAQMFYFKKPDTFTELKAKRFLIRDLRNAIAHYNFNDYKKNKMEYLKTLFLFEIYIGSTEDEFPDFDKKPSVKSILESIYIIRPDLFLSKETDTQYFYNKDRILVDLFDDIALYNGYECHELPSPWSILRQKYEVVKGEV